MTTIAANKKMMASDSQCSHGGLKTKATKIIEVNGDLIGVAGDLKDLYRFEKWYRGNRDIEINLDESDILVLTKDKKLFTYDGSIRLPVAEKFYSIGSGAYAAMAVMHMGGDPKEAISIAKKIDVNTGGAIEAREL